MFKKILIANRGEIALRVVRACKDMGVTACVAYSTADRNTAAVEEADERVCIGPAPSAQSYLDMARLVGAAVSRGCEAVHPGYGFLSENAEFARKCLENGLTFIGPDPDVIDRMGEKSNAKQTMKAAGVPTVPGSDGAVESVEEAARFAEEVGYPVLIKASAGGGGKGMREVHDPADLEHEYNAARAEARVAFGNDEVYLEKLITRPRHVEIQVMADNFGHAAAVCERDCSVQRRHQKLCEEAPSPALTPELRRQMCETAVKAVRATGYVNAGTIEFLLDEDGSYYFMEMNTRIQVEHPVTEEITRTDLVCEQLRIASGRAYDHPRRRHRHAGRPRLRVPHQRRGPRAQLPPVPGHHHPPAPARRPRCARGHARLRRLYHSADLRLTRGQAHRVGPYARAGARPRAPRAR